MWIDLSQIIVVFFCLVSIGALAYPESKQDYIAHQQRLHFGGRKNRVTSSTTVRPPSVFNHFNSNKVRHQSRFTKFDSLKPVIHKPSGTTTTVKPFGHGNRRRHSGWNSYGKTTTSDEGLFDTSDIFDDDVNDYNDGEDNEMEDDFYLDDEDDADNSEYILSDWQAEESTTKKPVQPPPHHQQYHSSLTDYKWEHFGTPLRVEQSRRQHMQIQQQQTHSTSSDQKGLNAFLEHFLRVKQQGQCSRPLPKVIPVQSEHPDPSKTYTPHCTVLHRCAEDTGCCKHNTRCQHKSRELVHLYFYSKVLGSSETNVEKLSFYNHTECECRNGNGSTPDAFRNGIGFKTGSNLYNIPPENLRRCKCPEQFTPRIRYDSSCTCECEDTNMDCFRMKKGKEHFGITDRKCILDHKCEVPVCEYGTYLKQIGRCPRKLAPSEDSLF